MCSYLRAFDVCMRSVFAYMLVFSVCGDEENDLAARDATRRARKRVKFVSRSMSTLPRVYRGELSNVNS